VVLYEMLTGQSPFESVLPQEVWNKLLKQEPTPPSQVIRALPRSIDAVVAKALAKKPERRFASGVELLRALEPFYQVPGRDLVAQQLGGRVKMMGHRERPETTQHDLAAFLPPEEDRASDHTQEIHLDEILDLVDSDGVPRAARPPTELPTVQVNPVAPHPKRKVPRWAWWVAGGVLGLLLAALLIWKLWPSPVGYMSVTSDMRAEVLVDGEPMGLAPLRRLPLPPGVHQVELRRPGKRGTKSFQPTIEEDQEASVQATWPRPPPKKPPRGPRKRN
jgi:hypothetical protein